MGGFSVDCGFNEVRSGFGQGIQEGSPSVPGSSMLKLMCGSMKLRCSWNLLTWSFSVAMWTSSTYLNHHLINVGDEEMAKDSKYSM